MAVKPAPVAALAAAMMASVDLDMVVVERYAKQAAKDGGEDLYKREAVRATALK